MKKGLVSFALLGLVINFQNFSDTVVENYVKSEASGGNAKVETNINTKVNETETIVRTNQPGEVEVKVENGKVEVKTSKGINPTIIIRQSNETSSSGQGSFFRMAEEVKKVEDRFQNFVKDLFRSIFGLFSR